jgi:hypothetical protein
MAAEILRNGYALAALLCVAGPLCYGADKFYTYVGDVSSSHVLIAWGTTAGENTIGRSSRSHGEAVLRLGSAEHVVTDRNWFQVGDLLPDTEYPYEVRVNGKVLGSGTARTWPEQTDRVRFFVIGDFGEGSSSQRQVASLMLKEFQRYARTDNPVRFVLTTGDNLYGTFGFTLRYRNTGNQDYEWEDKFFRPYEQINKHIPWYPTLGNHDGNESENREDLDAYLDNFFFPGNHRSRYYRFTFGGLVDFFGLDSTTNQPEGSPRPEFLPDSRQHKWLLQNLQQSRTPWKVAYLHHPPFNAGPRHPAVAEDVAHFMEAFEKNGVSVVFTGHEHNFQFSHLNERSGNIRYVVTGAGGELRTGNVRSSMAEANIEGWAPQLHFLSVSIESGVMRIAPVFARPTAVIDRNGNPIRMPLEIRPR